MVTYHSYAKLHLDKLVLNFSDSLFYLDQGSRICHSCTLLVHLGFDTFQLFRYLIREK